MRGGACDFCHLRPRCLPDGILDATAVTTLKRAIVAEPPKLRGTYLYHEGEAREAYFFIRSGSAKAFVTDESGAECVTGFYFATDMIGAASLGHGGYTESVVLLERTSVCQVPASALEDMCRGNFELNQRFFGKIAQAFSVERHARLRLNHASADERVADFLAEMSERQSVRGLLDDRLSLSMSRYEIANYLGLAAETVSRSLRRLHEDGIVAVKGRQLHIVQPQALLTAREGGVRG